MLGMWEFSCLYLFSLLFYFAYFLRTVADIPIGWCFGFGLPVEHTASFTLEFLKKRERRQRLVMVHIPGQSGRGYTLTGKEWGRWEKKSFSDGNV